MIFLGHISAGSDSHCSNLWARYVTRWPTLTYMISVIFRSTLYVFLWCDLSAGKTGGLKRESIVRCWWSCIEEELCALSLHLFSFADCFYCIEQVVHVAAWQWKAKAREHQKFKLQTISIFSTAGLSADQLPPFRSVRLWLHMIHSTPKMLYNMRPEWLLFLWWKSTVLLPRLYKLIS